MSQISALCFEECDPPAIVVYRIHRENMMYVLSADPTLMYCWLDI
jgi:hypothetical protein